MDQYLGKMLDNRYEILERIGTGGMAVVYKAKCHYLNRLVAVKILKSDLAQDEDFRRRFNAESQAVAQLSHPNIVSVYDVSKGGDTEYIVMELIDGITLKQYMEKRGQLSWRESLHFITQIMRALSHAHSRGIVHRDIKPQNIMVLRDGSVKVADFGIACLENSAQTLTQEALGSVHYISPEQARGDRTDARSDIYSAGVVLYEMLANRLPFEGDSAVSVAIQHLSSIPLAPREINPDIPKPLELICMKAMAPDLDKRYASADEMIADLEAFRKNPGVSLDFEMEDLRPEETDEPTRLLRTSHVSVAQSPVRRSARTEYRDEERELHPRKKKRRVGLLIGGFTAAAVLLFLLFHFIFSSFGSKEYVVPSVVGYTVEEAGELDGVKDVFKIEQSGTEPSEKYAAGAIVSQDPVDGTVKKSNLVITVVVSSGEEDGEMINVVGQEARSAERVTMKDLIKKYDLTVETTEEVSDEYPEGYVISSDPSEGGTLKRGDTVTLTVSKGPGKVTVPSFLSMDVDKATSAATNTYFLKVTTTTQASDEPVDTVIGQSIDANTEVDKGTAIQFTVSSGPEKKSMTIGVDLPSDRDTVQLVVDLDGEEVYNQTVDCSISSVQVPLTGTGTGQVTIYWDGVLHDQFEVQFPE
jgi:serine/threonine-protein kinase